MKNEVNFIDDALASYDFSENNIAIIQSKYHAEITDELLRGAIEVLKYYNVGSIVLLETAGAFELIYGCEKALMMLDDEEIVDGLIVLGCVIKGDTDHDVYINQAVTNSIAQSVLDNSLPIGLGLLTVNTIEQAKERAGGSYGNKGKEAALAMLHSLASEFKTL